jgi:amino acid permease
MPYGFHLCGLHLALAMITVNAVLSFITCFIIVETAERYGPRKVKTFIDLGMACFGKTGYYAVAILFLLN